MRLSCPGLLLLVVICSGSVFAQSSSSTRPLILGQQSSTPLLNRIDRIEGVQQSLTQSAPIVGDFNNDGNTDFFSVKWAPDGSTLVLQTWLGRGDGTILSVAETQMPGSWAMLNDQNNLLGAAVGDVNGDGKQDVVLLTSDGPSSSA